MKMKKPYLQWLVDMYTRERLYHHCRTNKGGKYNVVEWANQNKHLKQLGNIKEIKMKTKGSKNPKELVIAAVNSFSKRIAPSLMLKPPMKIQDSLKQVAHYIAATVSFVSGLVDEHKSSCPFQYDSGSMSI